MCTSIEEIHDVASKNNILLTDRSSLLALVSNYLSPSMCIPKNRLNTLIDQALYLQRQKCTFHNEDNSSGLLSDHVCSRENFPNTTSHILNEHEDEVWFMDFSKCGKRLASASKDARAIIWDVEVNSLLTRNSLFNSS
jgi:WD repeat-containing protein 26